MGILEDVFLLGLSALLLLLAILAKRSQNLNKYWEIPFAFFVFTIAGFASDAMISPLQSAFLQYVVHEAPTANNPLATSVVGTVLAQLFGTLCLVVPIILLTRASGSDLKSIFLAKPRNRWTIIVGLGVFLLFFLATASGRTRNFIPTNNITPARFLALTPALLILVLCNGLREELWFRGLFLNKYGKFLGPFASNVLTAIIFTSFHVQVQYSSSLPLFLAIALVQALVLGYLMQKSGSLLASVIFHAGSDIPIFLTYLSFATG